MHPGCTVHDLGISLASGLGPGRVNSIRHQQQHAAAAAYFQLFALIWATRKDLAPKPERTPGRGMGGGKASRRAVYLLTYSLVLCLCHWRGDPVEPAPGLGFTVKAQKTPGAAWSLAYVTRKHKSPPVTCRRVPMCVCVCVLVWILTLHGNISGTKSCPRPFNPFSCYFFSLSAVLSRFLLFHSSAMIRSLEGFVLPAPPPPPWHEGYLIALQPQECMCDGLATW